MMDLFSTDPVKIWTFIIVGLSFALYIGIAWRAKAESTSDFYVAGSRVGAVANGMATAAGWMSAASFISMAGMMSFLGRDGAMYLMGWTGGYVLLALLLAPYLRKFGKYTVPDFVGERYYSQTARVAALVCAIFVSFTYVAGQMRGVGVVFARFLEVPVEFGVIIGMAIVFIYAVTGGQKGITYTQVAQYCVLIFAYMLPTFFISLLMTDTLLPQIGFGAELTTEPGTSLLDKLDGLSQDLGFAAYTGRGSKTVIDVFFITLSLMVGTAGLPHVITRFFTVPRVKDARLSAGWALLFIVILYATAPAVAAFARTNLLTTVHNAEYARVPDWFSKWEETGLIRFSDKNQDGRIQYYNDRNPVFAEYAAGQGWQGNELYIDRDIIVLANPEIAQLPAWIIALVAAGGLAAALSTAAGLLLVLSMSVSHDLMKKVIRPDITEQQELRYARLAAAGAVIIAGYFGINPPGFVAQVVAFAFGLAASSFFPVIVLGIFSKRMNRAGAIAGMICGMSFTTAYIIYFKFISPEANTAEHWLWGISPEGIGGIGMLLNFGVALVLSSFTSPPPTAVQDMVEKIRIPRS
ncbi:MAG: cation acetate symporter [Nitrospinae bacterium]|nr:cation acetate symporter [Nitrospinota bacterium]